jgi:ribosomal protein L44E
MWKFFLDGTYAHGTHNDFISWLEQHDAAQKLNYDEMATAPDVEPPTSLLPIALASGPIIGGRFLQTNRVAMLLVPLWDVMLEYMDTEYISALDGESKTNKLAQDVIVFLKQAWRLPMVRAAAMGYGDVLGPFLFQLRKDQTVLLVADWWVKLEEELAELVLNPDTLLQRVKAGSPLVAIKWTFADVNAEDTRWVSKVGSHVHTHSMRIVHSGGADEHEQIAAAAAYMVVFLRDAIRHYGRRFLSGGDLHLPTMRPQLKTLLEDSQAIALNDLVESLFGIVDRHVTTTSTKNQVVSIQTHVQSVTNPIMAWWDSLSDDEQRSERENAKLKAPLLKARSAAASKAAAGQRRAARKQKAIDGQTKETNRVTKTGRVQAKNLTRFRTTEELEAGLLKTTTKAEKEKLVSEELEVYKEFYKAVVVVTKDGEEMTLGNARDDDGLPYWQKSQKNKQRPFATRYANLRYLVRWMAGTDRDDTSANARRLIARDARAVKPMSAEEAMLAATANPAAIKSRGSWKTAAERVSTMRKTFGFITRVAGDECGPEGYIAAIANDGELVWRPAVHRTQLV